MRCVTLAFVAAFVFGAAPASAASPWEKLADPLFVRVDTRELPSGSINAIAQDAAGFVWVGTQDGLARFDGYHFKVFAPDQADLKALPDGDVLAMVTDSAGALWMGTKSRGLVRFDISTETFRSWHPDPTGRTGPRSASVNAVAVDPLGGIWTGGDGGIDRYDPRTQRFTPFGLDKAGRHEPAVWALLVDRRQTVWVGTSHGLFARPEGSATFHSIDLSVRPDNDRSPIVWCLYEDHAGKLWAGSDNALFVVDGARREAYRSWPADASTLGAGSQFAIVEPTPGTIWVGTNEDGLSIIDTASRRVHRVTPDPNNPGGLKAGELWQFFRDRSGLLWLAKNAGGLLLYNPLAKGTYVLSASRPELAMSGQGAGSVLAQNGTLWAGGSHGSLARLDPRTMSATKAQVPTNGFVTALTPARDGALWVGTAQGMCRLPSARIVAECPAGPKEIRTSTIWRGVEVGSTLWVGTREGLVEQDDTTGAVTVFRAGSGPHALSNDEVRTVYRDRAGYIWAGTSDGLNRIDPRTRLVRRFTFDPKNNNTIGPGLIWAILEDERGRIWSGTVGGPLDVLQIDGDTVRVRRLDRADGLPDENVYGLASDHDGRIWASTENGIAVFDRGSLHARSLGLIDGVLDQLYWGSAETQSSDGTIFFGSFYGVTAIAPHAESPWNYAPPIVLTSLRAGEQSIPVDGPNRGGDVDLQPGDRTIAAEFSSLDYSAPQALRYEYELEGFDRNWIPTDATHRTATYTNLAPGAYTLRIRGTNRLGVWSGHAFALRVNALPAWYETWWFRSLLGLLAIALVFWAVQWRTAVLRKRQRFLEAIVDERTHELSLANAALQHANVALEDASLTDPLTGLRNRRFLLQHIDDDVALAVRRYHDSLASRTGAPPPDADLLFFMVDIDHFKAVNDELGHAAGDRVLAQMRQRLEQVFRESDYVLRWGGEEFLAIARGSRRGDAPEIAERLLEAISATPFALDGGQTLAKTASIGFAAFPFVPADPQAVTWTHVVELADRALYLAKHGGRNTWFGLAANDRTDVAALTEELATASDGAMRPGTLNVLARDAPK
jgi:diguanylate cyclase (GGDEF)-like protein